MASAQKETSIPESVPKEGKMTVIKITTIDGSVYYCKPGTKVSVTKAPEIQIAEPIMMDRQEFNAIPATNAAAALFGN